MKTHELKLEIKYFDDVKSGKKNFEIRKNDRDFQVGDILELKAYVKGLKSFAKWGEIIDPFNNFRMSHNYMTCAEDDADTIFGLRAQKFFTPTIAAGLNYTTTDGIDSFGINGTFRF